MADQQRPLLELRGLSKRFGGVEALSQVSLDIAAGAAVGIIGPNGSGKTTLFDCISGLSRPSSGSILFTGRSIDRLPVYRRARAGIRRTFQNNALFDGMTAFDNVRVAAEHAYDPERRPREVAASLVDDIGLAPFARTPAGALSTGYRKRLEIARAIAGNPKLLLLDEPTAGILPRDVEPIIALINSLRSTKGVTVLIVEHEIPVVTALADRLIVLDFGRVIADGAPDSVRQNSAVKSAYLGGVA